MLYELLTGQRPDSPYIPASTISDSHPDFDPIIEKAINPKPHLRYNSAATMADEIHELVTHLEADRYQGPVKAPTVPLETRPHNLVEAKTSRAISQGAFFVILIVAVISVVATIMSVIG